MKSMGKKVFVGLSGGVDSAVTAALLKEKGFNVTGVFIKVWQPSAGWRIAPCTWREERRDAMRVALHLGIPFVFFDFEKEYKRGVAEQMLEEYAKGRTPNPDILCNREIKFGAFWREAEKMGADYIATGHYAKIRGGRSKVSSPAHGQRGEFAIDDTLLRLQEAKDKEKDQSYFLWTLTQNDLAHTLFPIGDLTKDEVRHLAKKYKLPVAEKKDSQGICFIGEVEMSDFLSHYLVTKPGRVLNTAGEVIGRHKGALLYTIGERHGFEVTIKGPASKPYYVVEKNLRANTIIVSDDPVEISQLSPSRVVLKNVNWVNEPDEPSVEARIRYRGEKIPVELSLEGKKLVANFTSPMRGLSLGQSIVFYKGEDLLGGAVMDALVV